MDLSFLDTSSNMTPLLVRLYDSQQLYGLAKDNKPEARAELTEAVSDLLDMALSEREKELIAEVLIELLRKAEIDLRQVLAQKLSLLDDVPLRLVLQLANDEITVAQPVLKNSPVLGDMDLAYIIKSKPAAYWQAIAAREQMSDHVIDMLADTKDFDTALTLSENMNVTLSEHAIVMLSDLAQTSEVLAQPLLRRTEISADIAAKLYQCVGKSLQIFITENYNMHAAGLAHILEETVDELSAAAENISEFMPSQQMKDDAVRYQEKGLLTLKLMIGTLRRGQIQEFVAQLAHYTSLSPDTLETILSQSNGQGLAVICKAMDIEKEDFISMFLLTNRVRNHGQMVDLQNMTRAINYYNRIEKDIAEGILRNSLALG